MVPDTGSWAGDVRAMANTFASFFADPVEVSQNAIMAGGGHPDFVAAVLEHYQGFFAEWRDLVTRAVARGEVREDLDVDTVLLTLASSFITVPLLFRGHTTATQLARIVALVLCGAAVAP